MANEEHLNVLKQGVEAWNQWREENPDIRPDLSSANLSRTTLIGANLGQVDFHGATLFKGILRTANLSRADLRMTDLRAATLVEANLSRADLSGANLGLATLFKATLKGANLSWANLCGDLSEANFSEADLSRANLRTATLRGANLFEASVGLTTFGDTDLSTVKGLETVHHGGPSTIGVDTISRSKGTIPEAFLRGCGLSDWEIEATKFYRPDLTSAQFTDITYKIHDLRMIAIQYYSCFISYSHNDEDFAQSLHADLQQNGVRCWFAPEKLKGGDKLYPQIDQAIRFHDKLLLVLSEYSLESEWVKTEIRRTRQVELKEKQRKLFPIRLVDMDMLKAWECFDADTGKDLAVEIREYFIPDFSNWKDPDAYQKSFEQLLRDLKATG